MIYLYVKTHNITGLKYFGKTTRKDPAKYRGSGIYWKKHLKKHGNHVATKIVAIFDNEVDAERFAVDFSQKNDIVESKEWANLKDENGLDGSPKGVKFTLEHREKIRQSRLGRCFNDFDELTRQKMSTASKLRIEKQIVEGTHYFSGEKGSRFASERNCKKVEQGLHNFVGRVVVVDKKGVRLTITKEEFWNQTGPKNEWEYVQHTSLEGKKRLITAKEL